MNTLNDIIYSICQENENINSCDLDFLYEDFFYPIIDFGINDFLGV